MIDGKKLNLLGRKRCLDCLPLRHLLKARRPVVRPPLVKVCAACGTTFAAKEVIDGRARSLYRRSFCLDCSPFGAHNTAKVPPATGGLAEMRRKRRNAKTYRSQKRRRAARKAALIEARGGCCSDCGARVHVAVFEFHHRDAAGKLFALSEFNGALSRLLEEAEKCDLLCANCHRLRHARLLAPTTNPVAAHRRSRKERIVHLMGDRCEECGCTGPAPLFELHHLTRQARSSGSRSRVFRARGRRSSPNLRSA